MTSLPGAAVRTAQRPMPAVGAAEVIRDLDLGKYLFWQDTLWVDAAGNSVATAPFAQSLPTLSSIPRVGQAVTCAPGSWAGFPIPTFTYQWTRDGQAISSATGSTYTPVAADLNRTLGCTVTGTNTAGARSVSVGAAVQASTSLITVTPVTFTANSAPGTVVASLSGLAPGATVGIVDNGGRVTLNADASALVVDKVRTPAGTLVVRLKITPADGRSPQFITVALTITVTVDAPVNTALPTISGTAQVGQTLTASPGTWTNSPTSYAYQWSRGGVAISGATASTYTPVSADVGATLTVTVAAINAGGLAAATSLATSAVISAGTPLSISGAPGTVTIGDTTPFTPTISGGSTPYSVAATGLPPGRSIANATTGQTTGTYTTTGSYSVVYTVTDSTGATASFSRTVTVAAVIGPSTASFAVGAASGSLIATVTGLASGESVMSISPNDGRIAINAGGNALVVGLTTSSAGTVNYTLTTSAGRTRVIAISVAASTGDPTRWMFAATRLRFGTVTGALPAAGTFQCQSFFIGTPDYPTTEPRFFIPTFYQSTNGAANAEVAGNNTLNYEGLSIKVGGQWYSCPTAAFTIDPSTESCGYLLDAIPGVTLPANSLIECRIAFNGASGALVWGSVRANDLGESSLGSPRHAA